MTSITSKGSLVIGRLRDEYKRGKVDLVLVSKEKFTRAMHRFCAEAVSTFIRDYLAAHPKGAPGDQLIGVKRPRLDDNRPYVPVPCTYEELSIWTDAVYGEAPAVQWKFISFICASNALGSPDPDRSMIRFLKKLSIKKAYNFSQDNPMFVRTFARALNGDAWIDVEFDINEPEPYMTLRNMLEPYIEPHPLLMLDARFIKYSERFHELRTLIMISEVAEWDNLDELNIQFAQTETGFRSDFIKRAIWRRNKKFGINE